MNASYKKTRSEEHRYCLLCGPGNGRGLKLDFRPTKEGGVESSLKCSKTLQGYRNIVHGGVISALLDSAMTHCLFAHSIKALTAELKIRFSLPVNTKNTVQLRAWIEKSFGHYHMLKAELVQDRIVKAKATGKFIAFSHAPLQSQRAQKRIPSAVAENSDRNLI